MAIPFAGSGADAVADCFFGYVEYLVDEGFAYETRRHHISALRGFHRWLAEQALCVTELCRASRTYLAGRTDVCKRTHDGLRFSLNRFLHYLRERGVLCVTEEDRPFAELESGFVQWLREVRGLMESTIALRLGYVRHFLGWCSDEIGLDWMLTLDRTMVEDFFLAAGRLGFGRAFKRSLQTSVRQFLFFCHMHGDCPRDLSGAVPSYRSYRLAKAPRAIREEDAQRLLEGIDRVSASGLRDYAIIRLLYEYGVRGTQVRSLRLTDINWRSEEIFFAAAKGGKSCLSPLSPEVGNAILEYLQVRPKLPIDEVFLKLRAPYGPLHGSTTVSEIIRRRFRQLQIPSPVTGAHGFRHAFAARLLRQDTPFKHLADLMGHRHMQTTFIYSKIDFAALADVGLELPEVEA